MEEQKKIRCAIYTRKSTEEGLDKEYNTLEAQRDAGLSYVKSQAYQGWIALDEHYDDGGYSGGNIDRPALQRLLEDVKQDKIDMIVVYKIQNLYLHYLSFFHKIFFDFYLVFDNCEDYYYRNIFYYIY